MTLMLGEVNATQGSIADKVTAFAMTVPETVVLEPLESKRCSPKAFQELAMSIDIAKSLDYLL